jgi:hypothetical protein
MGDSAPTFSTGVGYLDAQFGGGIPAGGIIALIAPPDAQSETLFAEFAAAEPLLYASTITSDTDDLRDRIGPSHADPVDLQVEHFDPETLLSDPDECLESVPESTVLSIDPIDVIESSPTEQYLAVLNTLSARLREIGSIAFLHCLDGDETPSNRALTCKRADHVWRLRQAFHEDTLETKLVVPKSRSGDTVTESITLVLTDRVTVDTSRNIA